jgi:hypothetical protein
MRETVFHRELCEAFRRCGYWMARWPDTPASAMVAASDGRLRFTLPKPADVVGCQPGTGRFVAIEAKLLRARTFRVDPRMARQVAALQELARRNALALLALNFRFASPRLGRVNRAWLVLDLQPWAVAGAAGALDAMPALVATLQAHELRRVTGGWAIAASVGAQEAR